ncbi:MAG TPA: helix-turn-helix domain-containing protein, partial [Gemmatimonadales bacterium]|nr:helix-turn-helix domain-containing protein [Gemmatimonadales bacterium]
RFPGGHGAAASVSGNERRLAPNEILTIDEVAEYLRLTPQTIYKWAQERRIPAVKLGKEWRFRRSVIDKWFDDQLQWPAAQ